GRYLRILATGFFVATAAAIVLNALVWQRTRHPAPLFARAAPAVPANEPTIAGLIPVPRPPPQPAVAPIQARDNPVEKPPLEMPAGGHPRPTRIDSPPPRDEISQFLQAPPARPRAKPAAPAAHSKSVLAAQRALVKLGFVLNPDGVAGAATRHAIERYERDHGLPVRGEVTPALMRQMRAETGSAAN
ncbi:MAG: peptidoglycan-binding domain-containing protein, partial [Pseudomonadota bacterium]